MGRHAANETFTRVLRALTEALAQRRVVVIDYDAGVYDPARGTRRARVHPFAIEPSAQTHALYLFAHDEERGAQRTFKLERIRAAAVTPESFEPPDAAVAARMRAAWDVVGDETPVEVVVRFDPAVATRVAETRWHPSQRTEAGADGSLTWRATVAGILEVRSLDPRLGRGRGGHRSRPSCVIGSPTRSGAPPHATADELRARDLRIRQVGVTAASTSRPNQWRHIAS